MNEIIIGYGKTCKGDEINKSGRLFNNHHRPLRYISTKMEKKKKDLATHTIWARAFQAERSGKVSR